MRTRRLPVLLILAAALVTMPARAFDGPYQPDIQRVPYNQCEAMGDGSYYCDGGSPVTETCKNAQACSEAAIKDYNTASKRCAAIPSPAAQADCYFIAEITFTATYLSCQQSCH